MNWTHDSRNSRDTHDTHDITRHDERVERDAPRAALALDTVYMPSELAARLLPINVRRASARATWNRSARDADLGSQAR
jgi:hypothetical protein